MHKWVNDYLSNVLEKNNVGILDIIIRQKKTK